MARKEMKLYELSRNDLFRIDQEGCEDMPPLKFDHVDGMYSVCYNEEGQIVHVAAWTPVVKVAE